MSKTLENRILLQSVSTLLSLIVAIVGLTGMSITLLTAN